MLRPLTVVLLVVPIAIAQGQTVPVTNGSFDEGTEGWSLPDGCMGELSDEQAATGAHSLKIVDTDDDKGGSNVTGARIPAEGKGSYDLHWLTYPVSGSGCGVYVRVKDAEGKDVVRGDQYHRGAPSGPAGEWVPATIRIFTPSDARFLEIWVHSYSHSVVTCYLDDFRLEKVEYSPEPLWEPQYKLRPDETGRLTAADFPGPDGIVYPDWTYAGVPGGIPNVPEAASIADFGGKPNDDQDDAPALEQACVAVGEKGGGAVVLGEGTYILDRPVSIYEDGVVIRGQGPDKTKLIFRYGLPEEGIRVFQPAPGATVGKGTPIEVHFRPRGLLGWRVEVDGTEIRQADRGAHWGNTFQARLSGTDIVGKVDDGEHTLTAIARYKDGDLRTEIPIIVDSEASLTYPPGPRAIAALQFCGRGRISAKMPLAEDGKRGDRHLTLESSEGVEPGDRLFVDAPATERWKTLTKNKCQWGAYRQTRVVVESIEGNRVTINQPLRIEFPVVDGAYVQKLQPIRRCGVEGLYIEQTENLWISSVVFGYAWECWARDVVVKMCGRWPVYALSAKWCEVRDCVFDDAWFKGGGGTAYVGWEHACDCLMDRVETMAMRHAPCYQWAASGNVTRRSVFHNSDAQWHSGWTNENLYEDCIVESAAGNGGYGFGMWASPPEDTAHGPNGPRNVIYNCDISSPKTGLWMGGMNENWLVLYNRFVVDSGPAVFAKDFSFDHIIRGNVFVLKDERQPVLQLATPDCSGVEVVGNLVYGGNGKLYDGLADLELDEGNDLQALSDGARPSPTVPSIFEWQRRQRGIEYGM